MSLLDRIRTLGADIIELSEQVFHRVAYRESPDGWLAVVPTINADLADLQLSANPLILVCEAVEKPGNLGAMLRTADAAGVTAVIAAQPLTDWGNPNLVRASKGTVFTVPVAAATSVEVLMWLRQHGISIVTTTPHANTSFAEADFTGPSAIVVGSEKHGVTQDWLDQADQRVRLPMLGLVNSLNVATAAAIVTYEALRQRGY